LATSTTVVAASVMKLRNHSIFKYKTKNTLISLKILFVKHSFKVRKYLNQKVLRVVSLLDYSSIAELDDSNKIRPESCLSILP